MNVRGPFHRLNELASRATLFLSWLWVALLGPLSLRAEERPAREQIAAKGWTITFFPADRVVADALVGQLDEFEKRTAAIGAENSELGVAQIEIRGAELANCVSEICGLTSRAADFQREFARAIPELKLLVAAMDAAFHLRKVELWRAAEISGRLGSGETIAGFTWDEKERRPSVHFNFSWQTDKDYHATITCEMPPSVMLRIEENSSLADTVVVATKSLGEWTDAMGRTYSGILPLATRLSLMAPIRSVLANECADDPKSKWIAEGLTLWAWRELVIQTVSPKAVPQYAWTVLPLPVPRLAAKRVDLEDWPEKDASEHAAHAAQLFVNIAEMDGADELTALLKRFWQLPKEQRTSASLRRLYLERTDRPLELRAPWRSLGTPVAAPNSPS